MHFSQKEVYYMLPQKSPFVFIDEVDVIENGTSGIGIKKLDDMESIFNCHFPDNPVLPACIQIEMMAQTAIIIILSKYKKEDYKRIQAWLLSIENARFFSKITPKSLLNIKVKRLRTIKNVHCFLGEIYVNNELCTQAKFTALQQFKEYPDAGVPKHDLG